MSTEIISRRNTPLSFKVTLFFIFALFSMIALKVPLHSDDYSYALKLLSFHDRVHQYFAWSGRVVADFISSFLLRSFSHTIYSLINSFAATALIYFILRLAEAAIGERASNRCLMLLTIFLAYWLTNPNIGQSIFWVVGSANYLWTCLIAVAYFTLLIEVLSQTHSSSTKKTITFVLAFCAGCSNENTTLIYTALTISTFWFYHNKATIYYSLSIIAGSLVLLLAPGNFARAKTYPAFYNSNLLQKLDIFINTNLPLAFSDLWLTISLIICLALIFKIESVRARALAIISLGAAILSTLAFVAAPYLPPRALNPTCIMLIVCLTLVLLGIKKAHSGKAAALVASACALPFLASYYFINYAYTQVVLQDQIRMDIIKGAKANSEKTVWIPGFYFAKTLRLGDQLDSYHSPEAYGKYFGMEKITTSPVDFDYSRIESEKNRKNIVKENIFENTNLISYNTYSEPYTGEVVLLEFDGDLSEKIKTPNKVIFLHLQTIDKKGKETFLNRDFQPSCYKILGSCYKAAYGIPGGGKIEKITLGVYDTLTDKRESEINIKL